MPYPQPMPTLLRNTLIRALAALWLASGLAAAGAQTLTVAIDSSLDPAMTAVARGFESGRKGVAVKLVAGAPGTLLDRMAGGLLVDVLAGSHADTAALGQQRRLLQPELRSVFATNTLVLVVPATLKLPVQRLSDLARPEVLRIAVGRPAVEPAGRYAREAIDGQRLWPSVQRKVVNADDVRQVLGLVAAGDVEAGFVYATDVAAAAGRVRQVETLETTPVRYLVHVGTGSPQAALAREFVAYLGSDAARAVWLRHGFGVP